MKDDKSQIEIQQILDFWFEKITDGVLIDKKAMPFRKWFMKDKNFDEEIRERFEPILIRAQFGELLSWESDPRGRLALIILFDQFTRNMYRGTSKMFSSDPLAMALSRDAVRKGFDRRLILIERVFLYMPFMHAEQRDIQDLSMKHFGELVEESKSKSPQNTDYYQYTLGFAKRHFDIIERFGRFPHRNAILSRKSTPLEVDFLAHPESGF